MKKTKILLISSFLILLIYTAWQKKDTSSPTSKNTLVMGIVSGYAPWISLNEKGEYEGFDIDVAKAIAKKTNKTLCFKDMGSMAPLLMALDQHQVDAIIWGLDITKERLEKFAMVNYQGNTITTYPLIFWKEIPSKIQGLKDLKGKIVCVEPSSSQAAVIKKYKNIIIKPTERVDDALLTIQYKKADAAFIEPAIAQKFKNKFPQIQILPIALDPEDQINGVGIGINKTNLSLLQEITTAVESLKKEGTIAKLEKKWNIP